jgi:4-hydroxybenzoate polyprenyltransferase
MSAPENLGRAASPVPGPLRLLRPHQWTKGLLVFAALLFTRSFTDLHRLEETVEAFFAIAMLSSAVYVFNDLLDAPRDRMHPTKRKRPIASGEVTVPQAIALLIVCLGLGIGLSVPLGVPVLAVVGCYLALQLAYNFGLKRQPVADVFCIASGFVLRAALGAAAIHVAISGWLLFCTGALALLLGFGKRRHEFLLQGEDRGRSRESLESYTREALDAMILTAAASAAMSYGIYSVDSPTAHQFPGLILTAPFVFYGIYRYLWLIFGRNEGGEPEMLLLHDRHVIASVLFFVAAALVAMSGLTIPLIDTGSAHSILGGG